MSETNVIESKSIKIKGPMTTAPEHFKQQTSANASATTNDVTITKVEDHTLLFEEDLVHLRQQKLKHKAIVVHGVREIDCSDDSGVDEETTIDEGQEHQKKAMIDEEGLGKIRALDCDRLENMNLVFWQEKRLGQRSTEAALDLKSVKKLEYLSLIHLDLAYLQQQRLVRSIQASITGTDEGEGARNKLPWCHRETIAEMTS